MVTPAVFGGIMSLFVIATIASKEYKNHSRNKRERWNDLEAKREYRRKATNRKYRK